MNQAISFSSFNWVDRKQLAMWIDKTLEEKYLSHFLLKISLKQKTFIYLNVLLITSEEVISR